MDQQRNGLFQFPRFVAQEGLHSTSSWISPEELPMKWRCHCRQGCCSSLAHCRWLTSAQGGRCGIGGERKAVREVVCMT